MTICLSFFYPEVFCLLPGYEGVFGIGEVTGDVFIGIRKRVNHSVQFERFIPTTGNWNRDSTFKKLLLNSFTEYPYLLEQKHEI